MCFLLSKEGKSQRWMSEASSKSVIMMPLFKKAIVADK